MQGQATSTIFLYVRHHLLHTLTSAKKVEPCLFFFHPDSGRQLNRFESDAINVGSKRDLSSEPANYYGSSSALPVHSHHSFHMEYDCPPFLKP